VGTVKQVPADDMGSLVKDITSYDLAGVGAKGEGFYTIDKAGNSFFVKDIELTKADQDKLAIDLAKWRLIGADGIEGAQVLKDGKFSVEGLGAGTRVKGLVPEGFETFSIQAQMGFEGVGDVEFSKGHGKDAAWSAKSVLFQPPSLEKLAEAFIEDKSLPANALQQRWGWSKDEGA